MTGLHRCVSAALLVATMLPRSALADDESEARHLFALGQEQYRAGEYRLASDYFLRAHDLLPTPEFLFNAAQAHRLGQDCQRSANLYRQFLADVPDHQERDLIERHLHDMERCAERQRTHLQRAEDDTDTRDAHLSTSSSKRSDPLAWVMTGVGASLVTASALFAFDSHRASDDVERIFKQGDTWNSAADAIAQRGQRSERLAWVSGGVGIASLATATYLLLRDSDEGDGLVSQPQLSTVTKGAVAGWVWQF